MHTLSCTLVGKLTPPVQRAGNESFTCSVPDGADRIVWRRENDKPLPPHHRLVGDYDETIMYVER